MPRRRFLVITLWWVLRRCPHRLAPRCAARGDTNRRDAALTEAEARRLAAEEGLVLVPADNSTGFKNVRYDNKSHKSKPFKAEGEGHHGTRPLPRPLRHTAGEAALACARHRGPAGGAAAAAGAPSAGIMLSSLLLPMIWSPADAASADDPLSSLPLVRVTGEKRPRDACS